VLGAFALAVRVGYVLTYKHPVAIGGDAYQYHYGANLLADGRGFIDAYRYRLQGAVMQSADHPPGTTVLLAVASVLGMRSFFWHQLVMCLVGSVTVVIIAVTARLLSGHRAGLIAGVIAALYPNLWLNDGLVMSETVIQLTTALTVLAAYQWWKKPTSKRAALVGAAVGACVLTRAEAVLYIPLLIVPLIMLGRQHRWRRRAKQALLSVAVAGAVMAPWVGYNLSRFERPVTVSSGLGQALASTNCDTTYYGPYLGYWWQPCIVRLPVAKGDLSTVEAHYQADGLRYARAHARRVPVVVAARVGRAWGLFRPVQQIRLDMIETRELNFSQVGLGMYYALAAATIGGLWVLRRRRVPLTPILAPVGVVTAAVAVVLGETRYRASAEVVLIVGAAVGVAALVTRAVPWFAAHPLSRHRHFPCFDGLRALAALSVVVVHTSFVSGLTTKSWVGTYTSRMEIGVAVFFLISGFLLYRPFVVSHLAEQPSPSVSGYLRRRLLRILPAYWVALFFAAYVLHAVGPIHGFTATVTYFGLLQIYSGHYVLGGIPAAWTLCVELSFYLFLPVYAALLARMGRRRVEVAGRLADELVGVGLLFVVSLGWKAFVYATPTWPQTGAGTWLPAQLDLFALGMALAVASVWWSEHRRLPLVLGRRWMPMAAWSGALVAFWAVSTQAGLSRLPLFPATVQQIVARQWLYGLFAFLLILPAVFGPQDVGVVRKLLRSWPLTALGVVSYGVYLSHEVFIQEVRTWLHLRLFDASFWLLGLTVTALSVLAAAASYLLIERRCQRLGRRFSGGAGAVGGHPLGLAGPTDGVVDAPGVVMPSVERQSRSRSDV
jgi:peptidoglycan/LPS O-acetylase OafA/YrhL